MLTYPVHFPHPGYRGNDERKRQKMWEQLRVVQKVSKYVNEVGLKNPAPVHFYTYADIARVLQLDLDFVKTHCMVDGGHNGFMVLRPGLTHEQAEAEAKARLGRELG